MAQEEVQHRDRQQQADTAGLGQLGQRTGHALALVLVHANLDVADLRLLADRLDFGHGAAPHIDQVRVALLEDVEPDGRLAFEAPPVVHALRLEAYVGDIAQAQSAVVDDQFAQFAQFAQLAHRLHAQALSAIVDQAGGHREIHCPQSYREFVQRNAVCIQAIGVDRDLDFVRGRARDIDPRHSRQALDAPLELAVDQVIGARQVGGLAGEPHLQHRLVGGGELHYEVTLQILRQLGTNRVDALARLAGRDLDVAIPIGELHLHAGPVGTGTGFHALDAGQRRQRLFHRTHDGALDFFGRRPAVGQLHSDKRERHRWELLQRQAQCGDQPDHHQRYKQHGGGDRPFQAEFGDGHDCSSPASPWSAAATSLASMRWRARRPRST